MSPTRAGAFAANFTPATLNAFRELCKQQGKQYTKVLERLAELYLETDGKVLDASVPSAASTKKPSPASVDATAFQELLKRVEQLEGDLKTTADYLESQIEGTASRLEKLEK